MSTFTAFTDRFPELEPPLVLGELSYRTFEERAPLLPDAAVAEYVAPLEAALDEFTEVLPVARWRHAGYVALVYWKAGLLHNHYRLATFDTAGNPVDNRVVAGQYLGADGEVATSAATVTAERVVYIVSARAGITDALGDPVTSSAIRLGLDDGGVIEELGKASDT